MGLVKVVEKNVPSPRIFYDYAGAKTVVIKDIKSAIYSDKWYNEDGEEIVDVKINFSIKYDNHQNKKYRILYELSLYDKDGICIYKWNVTNESASLILIGTFNDSTASTCKISPKFSKLDEVVSAALDIRYCQEVSREISIIEDGIIEVSITEDEIIDNGFNWISGPTAVSDVKDERAIVLSGYIPEGDGYTAEDLESLSANNFGIFLASDEANKHSDAVDLRNYNGRSIITSVKNQKGCGTCVSFAVCGALESLHLSNNAVVLDLAESHIHFCLTSRPCAEGNYVNIVLDAVRNQGVTLESYYPYNPVNQSCSLYSGWNNYLYRLNNWSKITMIPQMLSALSDKPLIGVMNVY
ncbi:MAG TPA: C1 family peptidase, partial [Pedobacter sp.]